MREDIEFDAEGVTLRGWFYKPNDADGEVPCIIMTHGFSAIKEMRLDAFAEVFCRRRAGVLSSTTTAASGPRTPRPASRGRRSTRGSRSATTSTRSRTRSCARRSTPLASAYGARATRARTPTSRRDRPPREGRVRAGAAGLGRRAFEMLARIDFMGADLETARRRPPPAPAVRRRPCAGRRRGPDGAVRAAHAGLLRVLQRVRGPSWRNEVTLRRRAFQGYEPGDYIKRISRRRCSWSSHRTTGSSPASSLAAFDTGAHPKKLVLCPAVTSTPTSAPASRSPRAPRATGSSSTSSRPPRCRRPRRRRAPERR